MLLGFELAEVKLKFELIMMMKMMLPLLLLIVVVVTVGSFREAILVNPY